MLGKIFSAPGGPLIFFRLRKNAGGLELVNFFRAATPYGPHYGQPLGEVLVSRLIGNRLRLLRADSKHGSRNTSGFPPRFFFMSEITSGVHLIFWTNQLYGCQNFSSLRFFCWENSQNRKYFFSLCLNF